MRDKIVTGAFLGMMFGCGLGFQNFPYFDHPSSAHLFSFFASVLVFGFIGGFISYKWPCGK